MQDGNLYKYNKRNLCDALKKDSVRQNDGNLLDNCDGAIL